MSFYFPLLKALNDAGVRYVVVGGVAAVLHGHARFTADIDLMIDLSPGEAEKGVNALTAFGLVPRLPVPAAQFADPVIREQWVSEKGMEVFSLYAPDNPLLSVDVFVRHRIDFEKLWDRSQEMAIESEFVRACSIDDLIELKRIADRPQDQDDIRHLSAIRAMLREKGDNS